MWVISYIYLLKTLLTFGTPLSSSYRNKQTNPESVTELILQRGLIYLSWPTNYKNTCIRGILSPLPNVTQVFFFKINMDFSLEGSRMLKLKIYIYFWRNMATQQQNILCLHPLHLFFPLSLKLAVVFSSNKKKKKNTTELMQCHYTGWLSPNVYSSVASLLLTSYSIFKEII